jgi:hypothetical protein
MLRPTVAACVFVALYSIVASGWADTVPLLKNDTTGAVIFSDGFEGSTVGEPASSPWSSGAAASECVTAVCDLASEGFAAYEGSKYLKLYRPDVPGNVYVQGIGTAANSGDGDMVRLQIAFRVDGMESSIYATNGVGGTPLAELGMFGNGDVTVVTPDGNDWGVLTQKAHIGVWNTMVVTHQNGADAWSVSVNGAPFETRQGFAGMSALAFDGITMQSDNRNSTGYWDAMSVPEPSAFVVIMTGLVSLLAYTWRKRK